MNRREFCTLAVGATAAALLSGTPQALLATDRQAKPRRALMKLGCQRYGSDKPEDVAYYLRHRVEAVNRSTGGQPVEELVKTRERLARDGIDIIGRINVNFMTVLKGGPERDEHLKTICDDIRNAGEAGIDVLLYNLSVPGDGRTGSVPGRGGAGYPAWDLESTRKNPPVSSVGPIPAARAWEGITYFLEHAVPVAERAKVRLACHPHDPPYPPEGVGGIARVLGSVEGLKRFVTIAGSPYHGLNFCQGTVAEMLKNPGRDVYEIIRWFGERKKIFNVHFRNLRVGKDSFYEVYPDEGDVDMLQAMRVYRDVGYERYIMPDHLPTHPADSEQRQAFAYAYGYIRALIQAVDAEARGV